jgi:hypothetical protein
MTTRPTRAERLDRAIEALLRGSTPGVAAATAEIGGDDRPLVVVAESLRTTLAQPVVAPRFEARVGARLSGAAATPWVLRHPGRLIVTGAVGSALGVGVTAYAVWRSTRRPSGAAQRLQQR